MIQASWGPMSFEISENRIASLNGFSFAKELELETGTDKEGSSATNNKGVKASTFSLTYKASVMVGSDVLEEYKKWSDLVGQYAPFYLSEKKFGVDQYQLIKVGLSDCTLDNHGRIIVGTIEVGFSEYNHQEAELKPVPAASLVKEAEGLQHDESLESAAMITASADIKDAYAGGL